MGLRIGKSRQYLPVIAFTACCLAPSVVHAQSAEDKAAARTLGTEGIKLANAGDCAGAVDKLARAEALYHAPTILGRLGECQVALGKLVEGTENLNRVIREPLPANAPPAYAQARDRAQGVLDALDFSHNLYIVGGAPNAPWSDMNGYGHFLPGQLSFQAYWALFMVALLAVATGVIGGLVPAWSAARRPIAALLRE